RRGIADAPVHEVELRIVGPRDPRRAAASLPGVVVLRPGFVALLAARRNRVAAPQLLAGPGVPAVDEAADAELRAGDPGDEHTVRNERRDGQCIDVRACGALACLTVLADLHADGSVGAT